MAPAGKITISPLGLDKVEMEMEMGAAERSQVPMVAVWICGGRGREQTCQKVASDKMEAWPPSLVGKDRALNKAEGEGEREHPLVRAFEMTGIAGISIIPTSPQDLTVSWGVRQAADSINSPCSPPLNLIRGSGDGINSSSNRWHNDSGDLSFFVLSCMRKSRMLMSWM